MLDLKFIRDNVEDVKESVRKRGMEVDVDRILDLDEKRRNLIPKIEELRAERNKISDGGRPGKEGIERAKKIKKELQELEPRLEKTEEEIEDLLLEVPNVMHQDVPEGEGEGDNVEARARGVKTRFKFEPLDHEELGKRLGIIDMETGAKTSGSGFYFLKNEGVKLEMALVQFSLDFLIDRGFIPLITPELVRGEVAEGTGYIPRRESPDIYKVEDEDLWLSATAEMPITAMHGNEIMKEEELPKRYAGFSSCFRREAGAYGKHKKGIYRVHQFDKVEIYEFRKGSLEYSDPAFHKLIELEEDIYKKLKIPYRVVKNCSGDLSAPAYIKYDLEYWSPIDKTYREMTSCSNCTDFQARRLNIRYRDRKGDIHFVHTLNGTAVTSTRTIIAILENFQKKDGSVEMPDVLRKYTGFKKIKP